MKLAVVTNELLKAEFLSKQPGTGAGVYFVKAPEHIAADTDVIFDLLFNPTKERIAELKNFLPRPVFINAVGHTLAAIDQPFIRINAWPTFLKRNITEIAALPAQQHIVQIVFEQLGWKYQLVPDVTGMVSARITAMIINEAYFTLGEQVSTKEEIDTAMKLGTNYPYGPFEWGEKIGLKKIHEMLAALSKENKLYEVSALLTDEITS
jgi:3-hydroxybutyryl-CoA dehydrogenase